MDMETNFATFVREKRRSLGLSLRSFCQRKGYDPANISRIENGLLLPPQDKDKLRAYALALEIEEGTEDWVTFFDLAASATGKIPDDIIENYPQIKSVLPAFYRSIRSVDKEATKEDIQSLIQTITSPDND
jgi:transcriptional regulator with XRE-family HTH domain